MKTKIKKEKPVKRVTMIQIVNPRVLEVVYEERLHGVGRGATESAENLILEGAEVRRMKRVMAKN